MYLNIGLAIVTKKYLEQFEGTVSGKSIVKTQTLSIVLYKRIIALVTIKNISFCDYQNYMVIC